MTKFGKEAVKTVLDMSSYIRNYVLVHSCCLKLYARKGGQCKGFRACQLLIAKQEIMPFYTCIVKGIGRLSYCHGLKDGLQHLTQFW